jgi:hypothetical protein
LLTGLPPSQSALEQFVAAGAPGAFERAAGRLIESPQFGEHWARHWMDLVRYGETRGYEWNYEHPVAEAVAGGWEVSAIVRLAKGMPLRLVAPNSPGAYGFRILNARVEDLKNLNVSQRSPSFGSIRGRRARRRRSRWATRRTCGPTGRITSTSTSRRTSPWASGCGCSSGAKCTTSPTRRSLRRPD